MCFRPTAGRRGEDASHDVGRGAFVVGHRRWMRPRQQLRIGRRKLFRPHHSRTRRHAATHVLGVGGRRCCSTCRLSSRVGAAPLSRGGGARASRSPRLRCPRSPPARRRPPRRPISSAAATASGPAPRPPAGRRSVHGCAGGAQRARAADHGWGWGREETAHALPPCRQPPPPPPQPEPPPQPFDGPHGASDADAGTRFLNAPATPLGGRSLHGRTNSPPEPTDRTPVAQSLPRHGGHGQQRVLSAGTQGAATHRPWTIRPPARP